MATRIVLAIHSTWDVVGAALLRGDEVLAAETLEGGRSAIRLAGTLQRLVTGAGTALGDIEQLAVAVGPGSFTGIKIGLATAWGLSRTLGIGTVGVGSLEVMAAQAPAESAIWVLLPAGRGELYVGRFGPAGPGGRPCELAPGLSTRQQAAELVAGSRAIHLGCTALLEELGLASVLEAEPARLAPELGRLAAARLPLAAGLVPDPLYLRRTWAEESRDRRLAGSS